AHLWQTQGLEQKEVNEISAGEIVWINTPGDLTIGDTITTPDSQAVLPPLDIEEPTVSMFFCINNGPFAGKDGRPVTIRELKARLERELRVNVALRMEDLGRSDAVKVLGRGELHLGILIEEMRREGIEMCISRPEVITKRGPAGETLEPFEELVIDVPDQYQGVVIEKLARRKGELVSVDNAGTSVVRLDYKIPTRGLIGYRNEFLTDTRGLGILASRFVGYAPWAGEITSRVSGSLISLDTGPSTHYAIENLQERGLLFITPGDEVYAGMIVGENSRPADLACNPIKKRHVTNHRSANKEIDIPLNVPRKHTLDSALQWIGDDELVEVTPKHVRIRKAILDLEARKREEKKREATAAAAGA
ncbi:MAG: translational GTPase TypA, partial [Bdellovibrionota bacterium]